MKKDAIKFPSVWMPAFKRNVAIGIQASGCPAYKTIQLEISIDPGSLVTAFEVTLGLTLNKAQSLIDQLQAAIDKIECEAA